MQEQSYTHGGCFKTKKGAILCFHCLVYESFGGFWVGSPKKYGWWFSLWCHYSMYGSYESNMSLVYDSIVRIPILGGWINNFVDHIGLVQSWSLSKFDILIPSAKVVAQHCIFNNRLGPCIQHLRPFAILKSRGFNHESEITLIDSLQHFIDFGAVSELMLGQGFITKRSLYVWAILDLTSPLGYGSSHQGTNGPTSSFFGAKS